MKHLRIFAVAFTLILTVASHVYAVSYLIAPSEADNPTFRSQLSSLLGGAQVDYLDARIAAPTIAQLQAYAGVFTWSNYNYADSTAFGDNLAAYVDANGRVILGAFTTYSNGNYLTGQIMSSGYSPVTSPTGNNFFTSADYAGDGTSILWNGVSSYSATYRDDVVLQGSGIIDGTFTDGSIAAAYRPDLGVIYLGGMETIGSTSGDYLQLLANAFQADTTPVPEPSTFLLVGAGILGVGLLKRKSKIK